MSYFQIKITDEMKGMTVEEIAKKYNIDEGDSLYIAKKGNEDNEDMTIHQSIEKGYVFCKIEKDGKTYLFWFNDMPRSLRSLMLSDAVTVFEILMTWCDTTKGKYQVKDLIDRKQKNMTWHEFRNGGGEASTADPIKVRQVLRITRAFQEVTRDDKVETED
jgi:hypothetical protein